MSVIESFKKTITFFDEIQKEGLISDYALIGELALSAWIEPHSQDEIDIRLLFKKVNMNGLRKLAEKRHLLPRLISRACPSNS